MSDDVMLVSVKKKKEEVERFSRTSNRFVHDQSRTLTYDTLKCQQFAK